MNAAVPAAVTMPSAAPVAPEGLRVCSRCVYDTTIPEIVFDDEGVCQFCRIHEEMERQYPAGPEAQRRLEQLVDRVKAQGKGKDYDCIVGVSGGVDSTYTLYQAVKLGLRPLAVHFDNGWNSEVAVRNIENSVSRLNVDLHTHVVDWEDFKKLQISFLKASVSDAEIPTDMAIHAVLHQMADAEGVKHILIGHSFRTEGIVPKTWTYFEGSYIRGVHKRFSGSSRTSVPVLSLPGLFYYMALKRIKVSPLLNYFDYDKKKAGELLAREVGWEDYGGHHHESLYTKFFQSYLLPFKFGIDKRKLSFSARIRSGTMVRAEALRILREEPYPLNMDIVEYTMEKLGLSMADFEAIMAAPRRSFQDYPTLYPYMRALKTPITLGFKLGLVPKILYYKYIY
ncbi:7-cyano-7-deazaguanine synthase [Fundidesulfovibrio magnetotacticus]|uniref:7-cyano-7-deazaguanine synthase n=1 Tax=Fundidesulfovibrio magnetotacticus TaxID=2730080 RepID=A0A6V8LWK3_9BACT|nr:N-acetyl sugar amidotransferase [Fundidesulfovibrio magnetotacticus]GFK94186.1 7-cyano-7-deazaguanine synthase [Fundidesulfovibrio magnetotacticus]